MQIFITGLNSIKDYNRKYTPLYELKSIDCVRNIKQIILNMFNIDSRYFYLTYGGRVLNDNMTLDYYNIGSDSTLIFHCRI